MLANYRLAKIWSLSLGLMVLLAASSWLWLQVLRPSRGPAAYSSQVKDISHPGSVEKAIVLAKTRHEDVSWTHELHPDWTPYIYSASRLPEADYPLRPSGFRGREAITYLDFIIDNYDALPNVTAFVHAAKEQWHNEDLGPWTLTILENLRIDNVQRKGYVNLRCKHDPGCPISVNPHEPTEVDIQAKDIRAYFADVYMELFDVSASQVPDHIGGVCCGQFVVARDRIRERPLQDYERMRTWALESNVTDSFGVGWVFEKLWHVVFGMPAVQ